ncbi:RHS repeat domain-containing protein, partial [Xanthomonas sontii]|uniref:RHS repeat domain-containing protein n=1 Tax=Xanthomonas sontii TaxID=2650745 RepID=UPI0011E63FEF
VDSAAGTLSWDYDLFDQVTKAITPQGNIVYEYDAAGRRTKMIAANQAALEYRYDAVDRLRSLLQGSETVAFDYDAADRLTETTLPNGVKTGYAYNTANQTTGIAWLKPDGTALGEIGYGYDQVGRLVAQTGSFAPQALPAARSGSFDDNNRQTQADGQTLSYDTNGNLLSDGVRTYVWNARDQLVEIKQGTASIASFGYDPLGRRVSKTEGGQTISYLYDGLDAVQETQGGTVNPILTGLGIDKRYARNDASGRTYYLTDSLGSTRLLTDSEGKVVQRYDYDSYGSTAHSSAGFNNPYQYTGREKDQSGLYYYRARYYQPNLARFISEDPIGLAGGINSYAYVAGSPVLQVDPLGLATVVFLSGSIDSNPFGHIAVATTGAGIYSYGTVDPYGGSVGAYLKSQLKDRFVEAVVINTTPLQEALIRRSMEKNVGNYSVFSHNCSTAVGDALRSSGLNVGLDSSILPGRTFQDVLSLPGAKYLVIPKGASIPAELKQFDKVN